MYVQVVLELWVNSHGYPVEARLHCCTGAKDTNLCVGDPQIIHRWAKLSAVEVEGKRDANQLVPLQSIELLLDLQQ